MAATDIQTKDRAGADIEIAAKELAGVKFPRNILVDPSGNDIAPLTDAQLRATPVPISAEELTNLDADVGAASDSAASTDTGTFSLIALIKRGLQNWTTLLSRMPALVSGRIPVDGSGVVQSVSMASTTITGSVAVTGPLTDAQLRASSVPVSIGAIVAAALSSYTQAGVITINTVLLALDCSQYRGVSIQCVSMGTTGVVTPEWSNDNSNWVAATILTQAGATATTFNAAGLWVAPVMARYLRLRLSTATTAGTTTLSVHQFDDRAQMWMATQPVSGTVTATVTGGTQLPVTPTQSFVNSAANTNATSVKASAGTVWSIICSNANAAARYVKFYNLATAPTVGTSVPAFTIAVPANGTVTISGGANGIRFGTGIALAITAGAADSDTAAVAANDIKVATSYT